jgi:hypothetical protein
MFDIPTTTADKAKLAMQAQIAGSAITGIGSFFSAMSARRTLASQAAIDDINAQQYERAAQSALAAGNSQIGQITQRAGAIKSAQRTGFAANGIDLSQGSAAEVQASTDVMKEVDRNTAQINALSQAFGYRTQSVNLQNDATMKRAQMQGISPVGTMATTLLGSASKVSESWYAWDKAKNGIK